ncbi:MAG: putative Ig domain-containing protein, partial [Myxococcota bacterium]
MRDFFVSFGVWIWIGSTVAQAQIQAREWLQQSGQITLTRETYNRMTYVNMFKYAKVPAWPGSGWRLTPSPTTIDFRAKSRMRDQVHRCRQDLDFYYFATELIVPQGSNQPSFVIQVDALDDALSVMFVNSKYPQGVRPKEGMLFENTASNLPIKTQDLSTYVQPGETNVMILILGDYCASNVALEGVKIFVDQKQLLPGNTSNTAPQIQPVRDGRGVVSQPYAVKIDARDPDNPLTYKLQKAPQGARIDPRTGAVTWTPSVNDAKEHDFEVEVCDAKSACSLVAWKVYVTPQGGTNQAPQITSIPPSQWGVQKPFDYRPSWTDDPGQQHTWRMIQGPAAARIDLQTGEILWQPAPQDAGRAFTFVTEVCDNGRPQECAQQTFRVNVVQS